MTETGIENDRTMTRQKMENERSMPEDDMNMTEK